ncbi:sugar phosphate isomerase/epimerase family protein [Nocardioides pantholopis]|uniref:sugar phosphate isomerase/epimerase family protein n=1 Tax=Nocardioides pantholopis TaxID=2483798 RepID=UPI000F093781|nr:sugar phosphate isomerase/epimerase [Nocardioides pantholopis]
MCFGHDGEGALRRSLEEKGASRRTLFRGAALGAAGVAAVGSGLVQPAAAGDRHPGPDRHGQHGRRRGVPHDRVSIQLYTLRAALGGDPGFDVVLERLAQYGYERVELAGYYGRTAAALRDFLDGLGIRATSSHDGISADRTALRTKLENAVTLGQRYVVVPYLASSSLADWQRWADQMNAEAQLARRYGLRYGYHNHAHEFTTDLGGGVTPWEVLTERLDPRLVHLEVDLYWAYTGGVGVGAADPDRFAIDVVRQAPQRVLQFHVKDRDAATGDMADLGTGVIDFPRIFGAHRVEEYIVENDTPDVTPLTSAAVGHLYLDHVRW